MVLPVTSTRTISWEGSEPKSEDSGSEKDQEVQGWRCQVHTVFSRSISLKRNKEKGQLLEKW